MSATHNLFLAPPSGKQNGGVMRHFGFRCHLVNSIVVVYLIGIWFTIHLYLFPSAVVSKGQRDSGCSVKFGLYFKLCRNMNFKRTYNSLRKRNYSNNTS